MRKSVSFQISHFISKVREVGIELESRFSAFGSKTNYDYEFTRNEFHGPALLDWQLVVREWLVLHFRHDHDLGNIDQPLLYDLILDIYFAMAQRHEVFPRQ